MSLTIGVDIGGTKIAAGVVDGSGRILARVRRPTPGDDGDATAGAVVAAVAELRAGHDVSAVGIGVPGFVSRDREDLLFAPNMAWPDRPLTRIVADATGLPTALENDGNAAAWAECRFGAGVGEDDVLMVAVGTGIGGGLVLGGRLHRGASGMAGEIGHLRVVPRGRRCGCAREGCWEAYGGGLALTTRAREAVAAGRPEAAALSELAGGRPERLVGAMVTLAAGAGDPFATGLLADLGRWVGEGIASLVAVLDPGVVVVGGGLSDAGELVLGPLRDAVATHLTGPADRRGPRVVRAALGNDAGLVGAADLARVDALVS